MLQQILKRHCTVMISIICALNIFCNISKGIQRKNSGLFYNSHSANFHVWVLGSLFMITLSSLSILFHIFSCDGHLMENSFTIWPTYCC